MPKCARCHRGRGTVLWTMELRKGKFETYICARCAGEIDEEKKNVTTDQDD